MVSAAGGTAGFEERLGIWKYCKLGTGTFPCIWDKVFSVYVIIDIILSRFLAKLVLQVKVHGVFVWFQPVADLLLY